MFATSTINNQRTQLIVAHNFPQKINLSLIFFFLFFYEYAKSTDAKHWFCSTSASKWFFISLRAININYFIITLFVIDFNCLGLYIGKVQFIWTMCRRCPNHLQHSGWFLFRVLLSTDIGRHIGAIRSSNQMKRAHRWCCSHMIASTSIINR